MPLFLKITFGALSVLSFLQLLALFYPTITPMIEGVRLTNSALIIIMGLGHIVVAYGIYIKQRWSMLLIIILPFLQYTILYLDIGLPPNEVLQHNLILSLGWLVIWTAYYYISGAKSYFVN